ncbi:HD domain-containing phosphohydrolase [Oceanospirillum sediminis]|uniref:HD-GYP domain-containing protein n=1 Tax=Oceanospirillum sediminis TaxID=2760088 RepID=A0A839IQF0_9GAMM|nr:HD-GYP domain-containing protein [Oceanospirillum sediminis]
MQYFPSPWQSFQHETTLTGKLYAISEQLRNLCPHVHRFSLAIYDDKTDLLSTYYSTSQADEAITRYQVKLSEVYSLQQMSQAGTPRVINDLNCLSEQNTYHSQTLLKQGWRSSYTVPMRYSGRFLGFLFFNSRAAQAFTGEEFNQLELMSQLITMLVYDDQMQARTLKAAVRSALALSCGRDAETGQHLERMGYYSRIIAHQVADKHGHGDQFVEQVFQFAPVHDLGKIAIPDYILLKPGRLEPAEYELMKTHTVRGAEMLEDILSHHGLEGGESVAVLRNIVLFHHELLDGSGYPNGLAGTEIPLESRIVAVADIFDALTSSRPYKKAWTNTDAMNTLKEMAGTKLCAECVNALEQQMAEVEVIQTLYQECSI